MIDIIIPYHLFYKGGRTGGFGMATFSFSIPIEYFSADSIIEIV